jgi:hypothetical protein
LLQKINPPPAPAAETVEASAGAELSSEDHEGEGKAEEIETEDKPEKEIKTRIGYTWDWAAPKGVKALDFGVDFVIQRFTQLEPLEPGEEDSAELSRVAAIVGEQKLGKIEVPPGWALVIAFVFFILSKVQGAQKRQDLQLPPAEKKPDPPKTAPTAATTAPDAANDVVTTVQPAPIAPTINTGGNAEGAVVGF